MSVHKNVQPIRSSRLAGYWWHIYTNVSSFIIKTSMETQLCLQIKLFLKVNLLNFESLTQSKNIQNLRQTGHRVHELWSDIQTNKQILVLYVYTSLGNRILIVTPAVYPHLVDFTGNLNFPYKTQLRTKLRTFPWGSLVPQSKFEANRSGGSRVFIGQTNRQKE